MSDALQNCGRDIVHHVCHCGFDSVWTWAGKYGQQWRIGHDIADDFDYPGYWDGYYYDILDMIDQGIGLEKYSGPGGWNDFDMLVVGLNGKSIGGSDMPGPGCTPLEYRTHFAMWCILCSPLIAGNDVRNMDDNTIETLTNKEIIALNQDKLGIQASKVKDDGDFEIFAKPLADSSWAVAVLNRSSKDVEMAVNFKEDLKLPWPKAKVRNLWLHQDMGQYTGSYVCSVLSHEAVTLKIVKID
jgi:alpha-galactosidase